MIRKKFYFYLRIFVFLLPVTSSSIKRQNIVCPCIVLIESLYTHRGGYKFVGKPQVTWTRAQIKGTSTEGGCSGEVTVHRTLVFARSPRFRFINACPRVVLNRLRLVTFANAAVSSRSSRASAFSTFFSFFVYFSIRASVWLIQNHLYTSRLFLNKLTDRVNNLLSKPSIPFCHHLSILLCLDLQNLSTHTQKNAHLRVWPNDHPMDVWIIGFHNLFLENWRKQFFSRHHFLMSFNVASVFSWLNFIFLTWTFFTLLFHVCFSNQWNTILFGFNNMHKPVICTFMLKKSFFDWNSRTKKILKIIFALWFQ